jgi:hypothetical protein
MKLVWHVSHLEESDWFRYILHDFIGEELTDLEFTCLEDDCIHVVSGNVTPLASLNPYFEACRLRSRRMVLLHASDEWFSGGYALYRHFDLVIRTHWTRLAVSPGIITIPLGYPNGTRLGAVATPTTARHYVWSFVGAMKASRIEMATALKTAEPNRFVKTAATGDGPKLTKAQFDTLLEDSIFSPCPMGNVMLESWRLYESLERGCIPLIERRRTLDYFRHVFGAHPIPTFTTWGQARLYVNRSLKDRAQLTALQSDLIAWWAGMKQQTRRTVEQALKGRSQREALGRFSERPHNRIPAVHQGLRLLELLQHQSGRSAWRRATKPFGPLARIARDYVSHGR